MTRANMIRPIPSRVALAVACVLLGACSVAPRYERPEVDTGASWETNGQAQSAASLPSDWQQLFGNAELDELMAQALAANHDLAVAATRIDQARATLRAARSGLLPYASLSATGSRERRSTSSVSSTDTTEDATLTVSYEADLWGGIAADARSAAARVAASEYDLAATRLVLQADVATAYLQSLALQDRIAITQKSLEAARQLLSLVEVRFSNGAATGLDVAQQRTTLLTIEVEIPQLQQSLVETQSALALLLGRAPQDFRVRGTSLAGIVPPAIDPSQPVNLLERRPDVRAAEADLISANADIGVARSALYPSLSLSASAAASGWASGGATTITSLAASLVQTVFDGGELRSEVARTRAVKRELVESYAQTVLTGVKEAHDSLSAVITSAERTNLLTQTTEQARRALDIATVRYRAGSEDLLTLLESQRSLLSAEDNLVQAQLARLDAAVDLFKALGGGWSGEPSEAG